MSEEEIQKIKCIHLADYKASDKLCPAIEELKKEKEKNKELEHQQQVEIEGRKILVNLNENLKEELNKEKEINQMFKDLLVDLVNQFAYEDDDPKTRGSSLEKLYTGGLSVLEDAFYVLNIDEAITREELWKLKKENK